MGEVRVARPYYHCAHCRHGHVPLDHEVGLTTARLTPAAAEVTCLAGVQTSFAQAAEVTLKKMCGLQLTESTVERTTESTGARLTELLEEGQTFAQPEPWEWQHDAAGHTCA